MKKEKVKDLVRECLAFMKKMENLEEELRGLRNRFDKFGSVALKKKTGVVVLCGVGPKGVIVFTMKQF